ncbi:MAG: AAA family ATPase, partial [Candidatus Kapaibacteriota bacterium]
TDSSENNSENETATDSDSEPPPSIEEEDEIEVGKDGEFIIPKSVWKNDVLRGKLADVLQCIKENTPTLEELLEADMRLLDKATLFEYLQVFLSSMPMSEERMALRKQVRRLIEHHKKEYTHYAQRESEVKAFEDKCIAIRDLSDIQYKIINLETSEENKEVLFRKLLELRDLDEIDPEFYKLKNWLMIALQLPYDHVRDFHVELHGLTIYDKLLEIRRVLDNHLYGMEKVKEQILLFLHSKLHNPSLRGCCLGLVGPPGIGKTTIARVLANALKLPFQQICFGGMQNTEYLKGHDFTYVGSKPGEIVRCLTRMKCKNGILFMDEYEKISQNLDIVSVLLHITDFSQNDRFQDNYLSDLTIDLSSLWFIYSMNELPENDALRDRIYAIHIDGYSTNEKSVIGSKYLFPKHIAAWEGLQETDIVCPE